MTDSAEWERGITDVFPLVESDFFSVPRRIKLGIDPTSNYIHLGHSILLRKLRGFQDSGHTPVVIIGDFTTRIGDPSGKSATRKQLSKEEVDGNVSSIVDAVSRFIDMDKCELVFNSEHLSSFAFQDVIRLQSMSTVQQMLAKQDFSNRLRDNTPIGLHEFMYPLVQGYDSFFVKSDVELGGS